MWQSLPKNVRNAVLKMELPLCVVTPCKVCTVIHFSSTQNKSGIKTQKGNVFDVH